MQLACPFSEVLEVIVVIGNLAEIEVFVEGLAKIKYLTILPFVFLEIGAIDDGELREFRNRPLPNVSISELVANWIVADIEVF